MLHRIQKIIAWYKRPNKSWLADTLESFIVIIPVVFLIKTCIFGLYQVPTCSMENTMLVGERFFADKMTPYFRGPKHGEIIAFNHPCYNYSKNPIINWYQRYIDLSIVSWTKRVIGIPGDHIEGKIEDGKAVVYRNGEKLDEPYVNQYPIIELFKPDLIENNNFSAGMVRRTFDPSLKLNDSKQPFYRINPIEAARAKQYASQSIYYPHVAEDKDVFDVYLGENEYWAMGDNRRGSYDSRGWGKLSGHLIHGRILFRIWSSDSDASWWIVDLIKHPIDFWTRMRWSRCLNIVR
ncbi:signal peptidase I [Candidatus Babeliales bacterium]|nr:signal peptidase I [Candidatus Babeliales bacterium]MBP9843784.1 signal peptidase I [Candidatus Babeliales bacterium]